MSDLTKLVVNAETGQSVEVELTAEEKAERLAYQQELEAQELAKAATRESALAKLAALGLTEEEIAAL
jgi:DNA-binding NarL/FixJ family response regulator